VSQQETPGEKVLPSKIYIGLDQLSSRQLKVVMGLVKEMGFTEKEISELVIRFGEQETAGSV
jgi:hypothetical protein